MKSTCIITVFGDIGLVTADALITSIHPGGIWCGQTDGIIQRYAGNSFHEQVSSVSPLNEGSTIIAKEDENNTALFNNVIFVISSRPDRISETIFRGVVAASEAGLHEIAIPITEHEVTLSGYKLVSVETANKVFNGLQRFLFLHKKYNSIKKITLVIDQEAPLVKEFLDKRIAGIDSSRLF